MGGDADADSQEPAVADLGREGERTGDSPPREPKPSLLLPLAVFALAVALLLLSGDLEEMARSVGSFRMRLLPAVLALSLVNYGLRMVRWEIYLRQIGVRVPLTASATIFSSGLAMSVTPGKAGELLKAYGLNRVAGTPIRRVVPVILMERVNDLAGVLLLVGLGSLAGSALPFLAVAAILIVFHAILFFPTPARRLLQRTFSVLKRPSLGEKILDAFDALAALARPTPLILGTLLSILAWGAEGVGLWLVVVGLDGQVSLPQSVMAYALATLAGAISFLPGGLIVTEGSMTLILVKLSLSHAQAAVATTICRIATLWFAVLLGCLALLWGWPRLRIRRPRKAPE